MPNYPSASNMDSDSNKEKGFHPSATAFLPPSLSANFSHKWHMDWSNYDPIYNQGSDNKSNPRRSIDVSPPSSLERLSLFFNRGGSEKITYNPDMHGKHIKSLSSKSSRSMVDSQWALKSQHRKLVREFCTGSRYLGEWNCFGMCGEGVYRYPHGVIYEGTFNNEGMFHGFGTLTYPNGQQFNGAWVNGKLLNKLGAESSEGMSPSIELCQVPDRRFLYEHKYGFGIPGKEHLTNKQPTPQLKKGYYDVGEGVYSPSQGYAISYTTQYYERKLSLYRSSIIDYRYHLLNVDDDDKPYSTDNEVINALKADLEHDFIIKDERVLEIPTQKKIEWIKKYCRSNPECPVGYQPQLYEVFTTGAKEDEQKIQQEYEKAPQYCNYECPVADPQQDNFKPISFIEKISKVSRSRTSDNLSAYRVRKKTLTKKSIVGNLNKSNSLSPGISEKELFHLKSGQESMSSPNLVDSGDVYHKNEIRTPSTKVIAEDIDEIISAKQEKLSIKPNGSGSIKKKIRIKHKRESLIKNTDGLIRSPDDSIGTQSEEKLSIRPQRSSETEVILETVEERGKTRTSDTTDVIISPSDKKRSILKQEKTHKVDKLVVPRIVSESKIAYLVNDSDHVLHAVERLK